MYWLGYSMISGVYPYPHTIVILLVDVGHFSRIHGSSSQIGLLPLLIGRVT